MKTSELRTHLNQENQDQMKNPLKFSFVRNVEGALMNSSQKAKRKDITVKIFITVTLSRVTGW